MTLSPHRQPPFWLALPCAAAGAVLLALAALRVLSLEQGSLGARVLVLLLLLVLAALSLFLLSLDHACTPRLLLCALLPVALAFLLRALPLDYVSYDYRDFLAHWAAYFRDNGGWAAVKDPVGNYNVPYLYFLAAISYLPVPDLYLIKLFSIFFDVLLAWGALRLVRKLSRPGSPAPFAAFCLALLMPTAVLNGALWAQCDSLYGALVVHALACALDKKPGSSVVLLAVAFSFKLQAVFLIPLWCALWFTRRVKFSHLCLFPVTYLATILPALLLGKPLGDILGVYFGQAEQYSAYLNLNAPSVYAFLPYGVEVDTALWARLGILAAFALVLGLLAVLFLFRDRVDGRILMTAAVILAVGVPFFLPHMHDRYFFLADALTLAWACVNWRRCLQAAAVQIASLGSYYAYLIQRYAYPLAWGSALVLCALLLSAGVLWRQLAELPRGGQAGAAPHP